MVHINFEKLLRELKGQVVNRPNKSNAGTLSGHAAGEPFEKRVYGDLKQLYPTNIFKQYEYLNDMYLKNPKHITVEQRNQLFTSLVVFFLLNRGVNATKAWSPVNLFSEKQNDTADIIYYENGFFNLIDVKTRNLDKSAMPPNIISAYKLAQTCALMIDNDDFDSFTIDYIEVEWKENKENDTLVCEQAYHRNLFMAKPESLYINWSAGLQIQFHVSELEQTWKGTRKEWCKAYLEHFVSSAKDRVKTMEDKFITPFLKYID